MHPALPVRLSWLIVLAVAVVASACASDPAAEEPEPPPGPVGSATCGAGQHACGTTCVADGANRPEVGCELGCGDACPTPDHGRATCSLAGTCDFTCTDPYVRLDGACVLAACEDAGYACGALGALDCGTCFGATGCGADHQCAIPEDSREPNDSVAQANDLGTFDDYDDPSLWIEDLSIHALSDEDWFQFRLLDGLDGGNPDTIIQLSNRMTQLGWLDSSHELTAWFRCDTADAGTSLACGEWLTTEDENSLSDPVLGVGCRVTARYVVWADLEPSCAGLSDDGVVTFRVRKPSAPRGDTYDLFVGVD